LEEYVNLWFIYIQVGTKAKTKIEMIEQIQKRIEKLNEVGQSSFNGNDYSFGFNTWRSGTLTLIRRILPNEKELIEQLQNINLRRVDLEKTDATAYNLEGCKNEAKEILQILIETIDQPSLQRDNPDDFWELLHPRVVQLSKKRFENGLFADAISACLREINMIIKEHVRQAIGQEIDGAPLMTRAFSANNPIIQLADLSNESGRNIQLGYMKIFEGAMIGIRNPKAHANLYPDFNKSLHLLFISSFMFIKLQESGIINEE
jgi:uncharacterized protein (TIGR02391 family)